MKKEEAIFALEYYKLHFANRAAVEAFDMAIEALEQEPKTDVLDKIRAEMQFYSNSFVLAGRNDLASAVSYCIEIIDKYKAESEDKE